MGDTRAADDVTAPLSPRIAVSANDLDTAVARGIINSEQRDGLLALASDERQRATPDVESRGGLLVTVGYWAGSLAVLFALGWFLVDRWKSLRPAGVLVVALLYATSFALSSVLLSRLGYRIAAALLTALTVGMAPIVAWCIESLAGVWPQPTIARDFYVADVLASVRWIPVELSMALAGLIAIRKVGFGLLVLTITVPSGIALVHLTSWLFDPELTMTLSGWMMLVGSALLFVAAHELDRRVPAEPEDYAGWVYASALGFLLFGLMSVADQTRLVPHLLPAVVVLLVAIGLALGRRMFLVPATVLFVAYLAWLAEEVFPTAVGFMLVMLTLGAALILGTVLAQRRFPQLLRRLSGGGGPRQAPAAIRFVFPTLTALAIVLLLASVPRARARRAELQERRNAQYRAQVLRQRSRESPAAARARQGRETREATTP